MPRYETEPKREPTDSEYFNFVVDKKLVHLAPDKLPKWWVIGDADSRYNCVGWTLGVKDLYVQNGTDSYPLGYVNGFYENFGYRSLGGAVPMPSKFQLYDVLSYGPTQDQVAHVAVYLDVPDVGPTWTSKMGPAQLITHGWMQLSAPNGEYGSFWPAYYTHGGTMPEYNGQDAEGETFEQTVQRLMRQYGLNRP